MKNIRNWKLITKLALPYAIILFILIFDFISLYFYIFSVDNNSRAIVIAGKNRMLTQKIAYTVELVTRANKNKQAELEEYLKEVDKNLITFEKGGYVSDFKEPLEPLPNELRYILLSVREQWEPYRQNLNVLIDAQLITYQKRTVVELSDSTEQSASASSFVTELSDKASDAVSYVEANSDPLFAEFDKLVKEIVLLKAQEDNKSFILTVVLFIFNLILIFGGVFFGKISIIKPIKYLADKTLELSKGDYNVKINLDCENLLGNIADNLHNLQTEILLKTQFVNELIAENYQTNYSPKNENDKLGSALLNFKNSLIEKSKNDIERNEKEAKQNWLTKKLAEFSEILRTDNNDISLFSFNLIKYIVNSLEANQGGLFLLNEDKKDDIYIELVASIAFDKRKYLQKRIEYGEGLVGRVIMEKKPIYMKLVPEDYILITSGLGSARPRNIILIPLMLGTEVFGVIEIASFTEMEEHQIEFLNKAGQSIAATLSGVKTNVRTAKLLKESQEQRLALAKKEEEMLQNMEVMKQIQEEAKLQEETLTSFTDSVNHTLIRAEFNIDGVLVYANTKFLHKLEYTSNMDIEGREIFSFIDNNDLPSFRKTWDNLTMGGSHFEGRIKHVTKRDNEVWMIATYTAVRDKEGRVQKILFLGIDVTEEEIRNLDYKGQIAALNISSIKVEISPSGILMYHNRMFRDTVGYTETQLETKVIFDFIPKQDITYFKLNWDRVLSSEIYQSEMRMVKENGDDAWLYATFAPVFDINNNVSKVILLASNVTERKLMEIKSVEDNQKILEQTEELSQNLEEVNTIREELEKKNALVEANNVRLARNEAILKKALDESIEKERLIAEKTTSLEASEEELRQNMEELMATQEELQKQKTAIEAQNAKILQNESVLKKALEKSMGKEKALMEKSAIVESREEELKQNMEELMAAQEALQQQTKILAQKNKEMLDNELIFKEKIEQAKQIELQNDLKIKELKELVSENEKLKEIIKKLEKKK